MAVSFEFAVSDAEAETRDAMKFKIGQRVEQIDDGSLGTVIRVPPSVPDVVAVLWDKDDDSNRSPQDLATAVNVKKLKALPIMKLRDLPAGTLYQPKRASRRSPEAVYEALGEGRWQGAGSFINGRLNLIAREDRPKLGYPIITGGPALNLDVKIVRKPIED